MEFLLHLVETLPIHIAKLRWRPPLANHLGAWVSRFDQFVHDWKLLDFRFHGEAEFPAAFAVFVI